jgi:hypothetical protein
MRNSMRYKTIIWSCVAFLSLLSCDEEENIDTQAPGILTGLTVTPTNGGGIINYDLPEDDDILYVKAVYTNSQGEEVFSVSSKHNTSVEVTGLNQTTPINVQLYVIDESQNRSKAVGFDFTPLESFIHLVQESMTISPDLGGVKVTWDNIASKTVFVYLYIQDGAEEIVRILSSNNAEESLFVRGLESKELSFSIKVEDFDGNMTELEDKGKFTPLFEEKIDKSTWALVSSQSINGDAYEGKTVNLWDDIVDTVETDNDNSYFIATRGDNGGSLNFPMDIVIDLNKNVKIQRFKFWQRAYWYNGGGKSYYYQEENLKSFNLYASTDGTTWNILGEFDLGTPELNSSGDIPAAVLQAASEGHEFSLPEISEAFRYLKFSITSNYGSTQIVVGSELTLYGLDNLTE